MFKSIKKFFAMLAADGETEINVTPIQLQTATAAMLIEMMQIDNVIQEKEKQLVSKVIRDRFSLSETETEKLLLDAEQQLKDATDYYQFTSLINKGFDQQQKQRIIKSLWEIAYVDGHLDMQEDYMVRKVADLLHVDHGELIKLRNRIKGSQDNDSAIGC